MKYLKANAVKRKAKQLGKRVAGGAIRILDVWIDKTIEVAAKNAGRYKTIRAEDFDPKGRL